MNDQNSSDYQPSLLAIFWERTKRPFLFIAVCLCAAIFLIYLQKQKQDYDKKTNAPYIIVDDDYKQDAEPLRTTTVTKLTEEIGNENSQRYINPIKYQHFKNSDEIISSLFTIVNSEKEKELTALHNKLLAAYKAKIDLEEEKRRAETEFAAFKENKPTSVNIELLRQWIESNDSKTSAVTVSGSSILKNIFDKELKNKSTTKPIFQISQLETTVSDYFKRDLNKIPVMIKQFNTEIGEKNKEFETIKKSIYTNLNSNEVVNKLFPPAKADVVRKNIFDGNSSLYVIYKLIEVTLIVIIVFGLLYVILIPIKHIFFIATSSDTLTKQAERFLERKDIANAASVMTVGKALLVTATTIGIGSAVIAGTTFSSQSDPIASDAEAESPKVVSRMSSNSTKNITDINAKSNKNNEIAQIEINQLAESINTLKTTVTDLKDKIENSPPLSLGSLPQDVVYIKNAIGIEKEDQTETLFGKMSKIDADINKGDDSIKTKLSHLGNPSTEADPSTLFNKIKDISNKMETIKPTDITPLVNSLTTIESDLKRVNTKIGDPNPPSPPNSKTDTLFIELYKTNSAVELISNRIGSPDPTDNKVSLSQLLTTNEINGKKTLMGHLLSIGSLVPNSRSGNFFTQTKDLFTSNKYFITPFLVEQLKKLNFNSDENLTKINNALGKLLEKNKDKYLILSADDLFDSIHKIDATISKEKWEKYKVFILPFSRLPRN